MEPLKVNEVHTFISTDVSSMIRVEQDTKCPEETTSISSPSRPPETCVTFSISAISVLYLPKSHTETSPPYQEYLVACYYLAL